MPCEEGKEEEEKVAKMDRITRILSTFSLRMSSLLSFRVYMSSSFLSVNLLRVSVFSEMNMPAIPFNTELVGWDRGTLSAPCATLTTWLSCKIAEL